MKRMNYIKILCFYNVGSCKELRQMKARNLGLNRRIGRIMFNLCRFGYFVEITPEAAAYIQMKRSVDLLQNRNRQM